MVVNYEVKLRQSKANDQNFTVIQKTGFVVFFIAWKKEVILDAI